MKVYKNLIGGNEFSFGKTFEAKSPFYDYSIQIQGVKPYDIDLAVRFAKSSQSKLRELGYLKRKEILKKTAENLDLQKEELGHAVKMMGMPVQYIRTYAQEIPGMLSHYSDTLEQRYQVINGKLARVFPELRSIEIKEPLEGFVYSIIPSNDPRALAFVFSVAGTIGIPAVLKVSKNELPIAHKIAKEAISQGYPANALNLLCWDTEDKKNAQDLHFYILKNHSPQFFIPFGSDNTVDEQLRYKKIKNIKIETVSEVLSKHKDKSLDDLLISDVIKDIDQNSHIEEIDALTGNVFRHTSGNCAVIVDGFSEKAVALTGYSAFEYPISCKSAKSAYFVGSQKDFELFKIGLANFAKMLLVGDPLKEKTQVGFVDSELLDQTLKKVEELRSLGQLEVVYGGERLEKSQATPLIVTTDDPESPFLTRETSIYMIALKRTDSLEQAVKECNLPGYKQRLAVSIITERQTSEVIRTILDSRPDQYHVGEITRSLHPPLHQGINYLERMSRTISARLTGAMMQSLSSSKQDIRQTYKVLFVDDKKDIADNTAEQMIFAYEEDKEFKGLARFETLVAYSGENAIETARRNPDIRAIVADMRMGGISGAKTIREIRKIIPDIEGIVLTAYADEIDKQDAQESGVADYILKQEYDPSLLWGVLKKRLLSGG